MAGTGKLELGIEYDPAGLQRPSLAALQHLAARVRRLKTRSQQFSSRAAQHLHRPSPAAVRVGARSRKGRHFTGW